MVSFGGDIVRTDDSRMFRYTMAAVGIMCFAIAFGVVAAYRSKVPTETAHTRTIGTQDQNERSARSNEDDDERWFVHITGAVLRPGVYEVRAGARLKDVVQKAGGVTANADMSQVNMAAKIEDEQRIDIPFRGGAAAETRAQPKSVAQDGDADRPMFAIAETKMKTQSANSGSRQSSMPTSGKIDINKGDADALKSLPGIGDVLSRAIIAYREKHGPFKEVEDIMNVSGIGKKRFETIKDSITVSGR